MMDIVPGNLYRLRVDHRCYTPGAVAVESDRIAGGELVLVMGVSRLLQGVYILTVLWDSKIFRLWAVSEDIELAEA